MGEVCFCAHQKQMHRVPVSYPRCHNCACLGVYTPMSDDGTILLAQGNEVTPVPRVVFEDGEQ